MSESKKVTASSIIPAVKPRIPPISDSFSSFRLRKGQSGRVLIVGGSEEYTGAPYFAGISALRTGADICHIVCHPLASIPLKSYSPELIVHPLMDPKYTKEECVSKARSILQRVHVVVVGPGLSRDNFVMDVSAAIVAEAIILDLPILFDAVKPTHQVSSATKTSALNQDGLYLIQMRPALIRGYGAAILTPNISEFVRLCDSFGLNAKDDHAFAVSELSKSMGGSVVMLKGETDVISDGQKNIFVDAKGSPRRCGGQGDLLSGAIATFLCWMQAFERGIYSHDEFNNGHEPHVGIETQDGTAMSISSSMLACAAGSILLKQTALRAFKKYGRAVSASAMVGFLGSVFDELFEDAAV